MWAVLIATVATSSMTEARPYELDEGELEDEYEDDFDEDLDPDLRARLRQEIWNADRGLRSTLGIAWLVQSLTLEDLSIGVEGSIGLRKRIGSSWDFQGRISLGLIFADELVPVGGFDATMRFGAQRFYLGLGPVGRIASQKTARRDVPVLVTPMEPEKRLAQFGGGGLIECGFLLRQDRSLDVGVRAVVTELFDADGRFELVVSATFGIAMAFDLGAPRGST